MNNWIISTLIWLGIVAIAVLGRRMEGSLLAPGVFFATVWSVAVGLPLIMAPEYVVAPAAVLWIFVFVGLVFAGSLLGRVIVQNTSSGIVCVSLDRQSRHLRITTVRLFLGVSLILGFVSAYLHLRSVGASFALFRSVADVFDVGATTAVARYHQGYAAPFMARILLIFVYSAPILAGYIAVSSRGRGNNVQVWMLVLTILSFIPGILIAAILTTKATILWLAIGYVAGRVTARVGTGDTSLKIAWRAVSLYGVIALCVLAATFTTMNMIRYGWEDPDRIGDAFIKLRHYAVGHIGGFSVWYQEYDRSREDLTLGAYTFAGVFEELGLGERSSGIFTDFASVAKGRHTNIYTLFRFVIDDFGFFGSIFAFFMFGIVGGTSYALLRLRRRTGALGFLSFFMISAWSPIASLVAYNSLLLAVAFSAAVYAIGFGTHRRMLTTRGI